MMFKILKFLAISVFTLVMLQDVHAQQDVAVTTRADGMVVRDIWARAGKPNSAAFMKIKNESETDRKVLTAKSDVASRVELHDHIWEGDVMKMRKVENFVIPAGATLELMPGGKHVMLFGVNEQVQEGHGFNLTLVMDNGQEIVLNVPVKPMNYNPKLDKSGCGCNH